MVYKITYEAKNQASNQRLPSRKFATTKKAKDLIVKIAKEDGAEKIKVTTVHKKIMYV